MLRAAACAAVATEIAALGHVVGGGGAPDLAVLIAGGAGLAAVLMGLARKRRGPLGILGAMLVSQVGFHLLFSVDSHDLVAAPAPAPVEPLRMVAFHLVAAAVATLVLTTGERAVFGMFAALARSVRIATPPTSVDLPPRWTARFRPFDALRPEGPLFSTSPRRGPPAADRHSSCPLVLC